MFLPRIYLTTQNRLNNFLNYTFLNHRISDVKYSCKTWLQLPEGVGYDPLSGLEWTLSERDGEQEVAQWVNVVPVQA
jgi:hypothetical protein